MKRLLRKLLIKTGMGVLLLSLLGCGTLMSLLPTVVAGITDAQMILDRIERYSDAFFLAQPDPKLQRNVDQAMDRCRVALNVALRTAEGTEDLTQADVDKAFDNFRKAYRNLLVLVEPLGVAEGAPGDKMAATPTGLTVPPPLALSPPGSGG